MQNAYPFSSFLMNFDNFLTSSTKQFAKLLFTPFAVTFANPFKIRFANGICSHLNHFLTDFAASAKS